MSESLPGVSLTCDQDPAIKFSGRNSSTVWNFQLCSEKLLKGVTLLGVEHLQHFSITDVSLISLEGKVDFEAKSRECLLEESDNKTQEEHQLEDDKTSKKFTYVMKLKFHFLSNLNLY